MKRAFILAVGIFLCLSLVSAVECNLNVSILNQDPVHAVPGETVKLVFQVAGVDNPSCGTVTFKLSPAYPFTLDPGVNPTTVINSGTYTQDYNSQATIPVTLRVDKEALDKSYTLKTSIGSSAKNGGASQEESFDIAVEDVKSDFDVFVQNYVYSTKTITFGIVNTGKNDVQALTVDLANQQSFAVQGSTKSVIGSLDANQDSTFTFQGTPKTGNVALKISYNDKNGVRRTVEKSAVFDSANFPDTTAKAGVSVWFYVVVVIVLLIVGRWAWKKWKGKKSK